MRIIALLLLSLAVTGLNALKPLTVDDSVYYYYAAHIAQHPFDPYGFHVGGYEANTVLAPPGMLYWWGAAIRLFGESPLAWKLSLFPLVCLFTFGLERLCRRFAGGIEMPLVFLLALSPTFLPCWNLMLDVPALALVIASLLLFFQACEA